MAMTVEEILIKVGVDIDELDKLDNASDGIATTSKKLARGQALANAQFKKANKQIREIMGASKQFKMELLSLGFGFAMISSAMNALLQPAFNTVGIFELFSTMLQVTFLPIALFVLNYIMIPLLNFFMSWPESIQLVVGALVGLVAVLAAIAGPIAFLGLFADSFLKGWAILGKMITPIITTIWNIIKFFFTGIGLLIAVVILAVVGFWLAWKTNFGRIRDWVTVIWEGVKKIIKGIKDAIGGLIDIFVGFFTLDGEKIKKGFSKLFNGVKDIIEGIIQSIVGVIATLGLSLLRGIIALVPKSVRNFVAKALGIENKEDTKQTGGYIPHTGLYKLHRGEEVIQSNQTLNFAPIITINSTGSSLDYERIKMTLSQQFAAELGRLSRR